MRIIRNTMTIADMSRFYDEGSLRINREYQRDPGLWPPNARTYFIDTILNEFPFPKITLRQTIDLKTRKSIREIIDGQQRFLTISDFLSDKLVLSKVSKYYQGKTFSALEEENQRSFLSYEVSVDTVIPTTEEEIFEIFRRINSYTLPLNNPEKRHASFQGEYKWFIIDFLDLYTPMFEKYAILTSREIARMQDADLLTECCQVLLDDGIVTRSVSKLENIYKKFDPEFPQKEQLKTQMVETLDFIKNDLSDLCQQKLLTGFLLYSLFSALAYNRWGISNIRERDVDRLPIIGTYTKNIPKAIEIISAMLSAIDRKDDSGRYAELVRASLRTTHSISNRKTRLKHFVKALQTA